MLIEAQFLIAPFHGQAWSRKPMTIPPKRCCDLEVHPYPELHAAISGECHAIGSDRGVAGTANEAIEAGIETDGVGNVIGLRSELQLGPVAEVPTLGERRVEYRSSRRHGRCCVGQLLPRRAGERDCRNKCRC